MATASVLVGVSAAAFAIVFRSALAAVFTHVYAASDVVTAFGALPHVARLIVPTLGGAIAASASGFLARRGAGPAMAEILEAATLGKRRLSLSTAFGKAAASYLAIASGGSIGREGPLLQVGAALGARWARWWDVPERQVRVLVAAGTAAGFAAAYNTPLAAVLFVLEIVVGTLSLEVVLPVVVATVVATSVTRLALGAGPLYGLHTFVLRSLSELVKYAALGLASGVLGAAFMALLAGASELFKRLSSPAPPRERLLCAARGALGGLGVGLCAVFLPEVTGNGYEVIQRLWSGPYTLGFLALLLMTKALATTSSVASGSPGGVFTPSLFLGAVLGSLAARVLAPSADGGFVLVGMASVIAATTHAPVMAALLGFELSQDYGLVLPLLMATAAATLVSRRLRPASIYTEELRRRGIAPAEPEEPAGGPSQRDS